MADLRFLASCIVPKRTRILGKSLKPFCLKYRLWLSAIGSPFLEPDKEIKIEDLIVALKVCSGESLNRATFSDYWSAIKLSLFKDIRVAAFKAFIDYSMTNESWPKFYDNSKNSSGSSTGLPWELSVIANLTRNGISYEEALNMPEASAIWLSTAFSMHAGSKLNLLTTDDEALIDHLAKLRDEELKKTDTK